jgi:flagellar hook-associated protein 2
MPISALAGLADAFLLALVRQAAGASRSGTHLAALFALPRTDAAAERPASELAGLLGTARRSLLSLATAARPLDLANPTSVFFTAAVTSSDDAAVAGRVVPGTSLETTPATASYVFTVSQLAQAQANVGTALDSDSVSSFTIGPNSLRVTQGGTSTDVTFVVGLADTNATVLGSMAAAINGDSTLGVTARVVTDEGAGTSRLVVQSEVSGAANAFTLADVFPFGTPVTHAGVGSVSTAAADASYTQDGVPLSSSTNEFYADANAKVKVTLVSATSSPVVLRVAPDETLIREAVASLVAAFNTAEGFLDAAPDLYPGAAADLDSVSSRLGAQLAHIGVALSPEGRLSIDSARLATAVALEPATVERTLGDAGGLAKEVHAIAETHLRLPLNTSPLPFAPGPAPRTLAGMFAARLAATRATGLLVDALV